VLKDSSLREVIDAVNVVANGQSLFSAAVAIAMLEQSQADEQSPGLPQLTDREMQVLRLVATGRANRDIARDLFISENTVKNHVRNILEKLRLHSRMEAVLYAVRQKLVELPS
jgi:two-component system NarL family response regulator